MNKKIILLLVLSLVGFAVGYFLADFLKNKDRFIDTEKSTISTESIASLSKKDSSLINEKKASAVNTIVPDQKEVSQVNNEKIATAIKKPDGVKADAQTGAATIIKPKKPSIISISDPLFNEAAMTWSFTVNATGKNLQYILCQSNNEQNIVINQDSPTFTIKGNLSGSYILYVESKDNSLISEKRSIQGCYLRVKKLLSYELERAFNSGDYQEGTKLDFRNRIANNCSIKASGISEEFNYLDIFSFILNEEWKQVSVTNVTYNNNYQVSSLSLLVEK